MTDDPFDILGLPARFDLGIEEVNAAYLARAGAIHPDVAGVDGAEESAASINRAAQLLKDPERRANALLLRLGGPAKEADRSLPPGFLMEMMQTREEIETEASMDHDAAREKWSAWSSSRRAEYAKEAGRLFAGLASPPDENQLRAIRTVLNAWRYIERLVEQLDPDYDPARADWE